MTSQDCEIAVVGAGIAGIAAAYYLCTRHGRSRVLLIEERQPMGLTSAQSGENYRNWWPHETMTRLTDDSLDLMEAISRETGNRIRMTRRGYALATRRAEAEELIAQLHPGYGPTAASMIRVHEGASSASYRPAVEAAWERAPGGVDVLRSRQLIRQHFPSFDPAVSTVIHIRRAGDIDGQQLGQYMLERIREAGGRLLRGRVVSIERADRFRLEVTGQKDTTSVRADLLVNAAGPFVGEIAAMLGESLGTSNVLQQKIAFEDGEGAIPRHLPFSIDLDAQRIDWSEEERAALAEDPATAWLAETLPGSIHCRPEGGDHGRWIKLGWAFNHRASEPQVEPPLEPQFPEIVLRGASRLNPALKTYYGRLPRQRSHYGGYYTTTEENWPLIGPMATAGAYVTGALSGFGTMAACAAGSLTAAWIAGAPLPAYTHQLSLARYKDKALMATLAGQASKGHL